MNALNFSFNAPIKQDVLFRTITDFENLSSYLPNQLKEIKILEKTTNSVMTEETILFKTIFKKTFKQKSLHKISSNEINTEIISGPSKGTIITIIFQNHENGTKIDINTNLKLEFKYKILTPLIKKYYSVVLTGIMYKIINSINN
tara:strand:- start:253 stop:687 length:435 start_codon:yes stop_codon:yes gene_type:complete